MKCRICNNQIGAKENRSYCYAKTSTGRLQKRYACSGCMETPEWDYYIGLTDALYLCRPKKNSLRHYLIPELVKLGARLLETKENETFGCVHETWEIKTGAGRLEIYPQDAYRSRVPSFNGKRARHGSSIHCRFDDGDLFGVYMGEPSHKVHNGKWNWYHFDAADDKQLAERFIQSLRQVIAWRPSPEHLAMAAEWRRANDIRWGRVTESEVA